MAENVIDERLQSADRIGAIDCVKGIAIIAIVVGHGIRGFHDAGMLGSPGWDVADRGLYLWHLPAFVFLAAVMVPVSVRRNGARRYLIRRELDFVYLYILWMVIQGAIRAAASGHTNQKKSLVDVLNFWRPDGQLWFLPFMMVASLLAASCVSGVSAKIRWIVLILVAGFGIAMWGIDGPYVGTQGLGLLVYFALGMLSGRSLLDYLAHSTALVLGALTAAAVAGVVVVLLIGNPLPPAMYPGERTVASVVAGVAVGALAVCALITSCSVLARGPLGVLLAALGERSLEIFLAHIVFLAGARIVLEMSSVALPAAVQLCVCCVAGIVGPLTLGQANALRWMFRRPRFRLALIPESETLQ